MEKKTFRSVGSLAYIVHIALVLVLIVSGSSLAAEPAGPPDDPGWPRTFQKKGKELTVYQPQVDYWRNYTDLHFRCAISVKTGKSKKEVFGIAEIDAETVADHARRVVAVFPKKRDLRFPNTTETEAKALRAAVNELHPPVQSLTVSLDRILACLDPDKQPQQQQVGLNLDPPKIFYSSTPAILILFQGEPQLQPVIENKSELMFAVNGNWDIFFDTASQRYYLLNGDNWLMTANLSEGAWTPAGNLPAGLSSLPPDENWADVRARVPGKRAAEPPEVFMATEPAELIVTRGKPAYTPISGTKLMRVANTEDVVFLNSADNNFYLLTAGRWFRAGSLSGSWSGASMDLPAEFGRIPDDDPSAFVKASVPGTTEAKDAVLLASVPTTTVMKMTDPVKVQVNYSGPPKFQPIAASTVSYAINTPNSVFLVDGSYYCCDRGVWFVSRAAAGPWALCATVPAAIYGIPPSHPMHYVTYVVVQNSSSTTVVYSQTAGYRGEYVAPSGVLMFGAGLMVGAAIADRHNDSYPLYPVPYSYGWGARYDYRHGGYYRAGHVAYGPYAGSGAGAVYNSRTGTYSRGAYAYGPMGSASARQTYNPDTGIRTSSARVDTADGSAGRVAAYNPNTGNAFRAGYRTDDRGTAAAVQTNRGTGAAGVRSQSGAGAAAWDTRRGQGAVVKDKQGNVYAGTDGNVYKRDDSGNWSTNTGSGWQSTGRPQPARDLNAQAGARARGNQLQGRFR